MKEMDVKYAMKDLVLIKMGYVLMMIIVQIRMMMGLVRNVKMMMMELIVLINIFDAK